MGVRFLIGMLKFFNNQVIVMVVQLQKHWGLSEMVLVVYINQISIKRDWIGCYKTVQDDLASTPDVLWSSSLLKCIMREVKFRSSLQVRKLTVLAVNVSVQEMENAEPRPRRRTSNSHNSSRAGSWENAKIPTPKHREEL